MNGTHTSSKNTLIICVWIGPWPAYLPYFSKTASQHFSINWLIVSDQTKPPHLPGNIEFQHYSTDDLNSLISEKLKFPVKITDPRKLCDFKPAYGLIFHSFLREYDYWGYCDLDLIFGDLTLAVDSQIEKGTEIISFYQDYVSGPLCLYRNSEKTRNLYKEIFNYQEILGKPEHYALDENNKNRMQDLAAHSNLRSRLSYLLSRIVNLSIFKQGLVETRYRYQWFLKKQVCALHPPNDMTDVIWSEFEKGKLSISFQDHIRSDRSYLRAGKKDWQIAWKNGKLTDAKGKNEIPVFHFIDLKNKLDKREIIPDEIPDEFYIDSKGFHI